MNPKEGFHVWVPSSATQYFKCKKNQEGLFTAKQIAKMIEGLVFLVPEIKMNKRIEKYLADNPVFAHGLEAL